MSKATVGIVGTGIYLPKQVMTAKYISDQTNGVWTEAAVIEKLGIKQKTLENQKINKSFCTRDGT